MTLITSHLIVSSPEYKFPFSVNYQKHDSGFKVQKLSLGLSCVIVKLPLAKVKLLPWPDWSVTPFPSLK